VGWSVRRVKPTGGPPLVGLGRCRAGGTGLRTSKLCVGGFGGGAMMRKWHMRAFSRR